MNAGSNAWFSALGAPLGAGELEDIQLYLDGFSLKRGEPLLVASWDDAAAIVKQPTESWWALEEAERMRLERSVRLDPATFDSTDGGWIKLNDELHGCAAIAASRFGFSDAGMIKVAAGAASYAAYHQQLARAASAPDTHPFQRKYALFVGGRWPLGVYGDRFAIF